MWYVGALGLLTSGSTAGSRVIPIGHLQGLAGSLPQGRRQDTPGRGLRLNDRLNVALA